MRPLGVVVDEPGIEVCLQRVDAGMTFSRSAMRKNSSSTVPLKRSTKPSVLGMRTRVLRCLISFSAR
jgi:hypothetical protein